MIIDYCSSMSPTSSLASTSVGVFNAQLSIINYQSTGPVNLTINLKKSNKKNRCLKLPAALTKADIINCPSAVQNNKTQHSQNVFQNPNLFLSSGLLHTSAYT